MIARYPLFYLLGLTASLMATAAGADRLDTNAVASPALVGEPLSTEALASVRGNGVDQRFWRRMAGQDQATINFQETAAVARVAMDNWWGQVGAALIANNLLSSR